MPYEIRWGPPPVLEGFTQFMLGRMGAKREAEKWEYEHQTPWGRIGGMGAGGTAGAIGGAALGTMIAPGVGTALGAIAIGGLGASVGGEMGGALFDPQTTAQSISGLRGAGEQVTDVGTRLLMQQAGIQAQQQAATQHQDALYSRMHLANWDMTPEEMTREKALEIQAGSIPADTTDAGYRQVLGKRRLQMTGDEYIRRDRNRHFLGRTGGGVSWDDAVTQNPDDPMAVLMPAMMEHQQQQQAVQQQQAQQAQQAQRVQQALGMIPSNSDESIELASARSSLAGLQAGHLPRGAGPQNRTALTQQARQRVQAAERAVVELAQSQQKSPEEIAAIWEKNRQVIPLNDGSEWVIQQIPGTDDIRTVTSKAPEPPKAEDVPIRSMEEYYARPADDKFRMETRKLAQQYADTEWERQAKAALEAGDEAMGPTPNWLVDHFEQKIMEGRLRQPTPDYRPGQHSTPTGAPMGQAGVQAMPSPAGVDPQVAQQLQETTMKIREIMAEIKSKRAELSEEQYQALIQEYIQLAQMKAQLEQGAGAGVP